ncbi:hypothetical protein [Streptomyces sp. NBC_00827]|uniref:hypothetical protein n=1 Tax=Streptomyces sp. NBC_00827 TaxID=2903677 RepID=UPI0038693682|nr:hypothetical protein OG569_12980 [Streptomyces sp. NBC_00827]
MAHSGGSGGRSPRARTWVGALAIALGCYAAGDTAGRVRTAAEVAAQWWPWALIGLALVNLLRSAVATEALIGPLTLGVVALGGLAMSHQVGGHTIENWVVPVGLAVAGAALVLPPDRNRRATRWSRVLSTGRVVVSADSGPLLTVRAVLGELRADLSQVDGTGGQVTVHVTAVGGHVRLLVPRECRVSVHRTGAALTRVTNNGPESPDGKGRFTVHVLGLCGAVSITRV